MKKKAFVESCKRDLKKKVRRMRNHGGKYTALLDLLLLVQTGKTYKQFMKSLYPAKAVSEIIYSPSPISVLAGRKQD
jgi:hypothetical protein